MKKTMATLAFLAALTLAGCGQVTPSADVTPEVTTSAAEEPTESATSSYHMKLIGDKTAGSSVFIITVDNKTGKDIKGFTVKAGSDEKYPSNMLRGDDIFVKDERRTLYYAPTNREGYAIGDSDAIASEEYTIKVDFSDDKSCVLHQFPFGSLDSASILLDGDTAYIEYVSKINDQKVSTKEAEKMIRTTEANDDVPDTDSSSDQAYTQPAYEEPVYTQPATAAYVEPTTVYVEPTTVYTEPPTPAPTEPPTEAPSSPDGGCIGDQGLFN